MTIAAFDDALLRHLAGAGDDLAEAQILQLLGNMPGGAVGVDQLSTRAVFGAIIGHIAVAPDGQRNDHIDDFVLGGGAIVPAIDVEMVRRAQAFFEDHGVLVITSLFHAALPEAYLGRRGVQVLDITGDLVSNWHRRIQETGQFLINVLSPDPLLANTDKTSLHPGGVGARSARKVRLIHAAVRLMIESSPPDQLYPVWWSALMGQDSLWGSRLAEVDDIDPPSRPLCQEDMLATLTTFTTMTLDAVEKLGVKADDGEREAFHHLWNVVGWHMGIGDAVALAGVEVPRAGLVFDHPKAFADNALLPLSSSEMDHLTVQLRARLQHPTDAGERLTRVLVRELKNPLPQSLRNAPDFLIRYLIGDDRADALGVDAGGYTDLVVRRSGVLRRLADLTKWGHVGEIFVQPLSKMVTRYALRAFVSESRSSDRGLEIPPHIAAQWGVQVAPREAQPTGTPW